ncbi:alanine racemase [Tropicimonas sediminicola]|uniref:Predicted amino acid racemase n=1 Tax=Tropicimonas sediminicola TaxID=1031541 RepID=A0A239MGP2_9RHOB|nr:alanine racemase [Tropicimonas sediminicola]SNT41841.1 Predicted amino acid racemase [Tropicimonas sediminicola]
MTAPRIEVDLGKIQRNTRSLVERLKTRGITVTGVTKAVCGHPDIANAMLAGGATGLADARITNVERMRKAGIFGHISMIRTPMLSQIERICASSETSYNTEMEVVAELAAEALRTSSIHNIILMVEVGDMREGIMPEDLADVASQVVKMPGVALRGIGANFTCLSGGSPNPEAMALLTSLASDIERSYGPVVEVVSGGSSASLPWALGLGAMGRINNLRLGEAILLGVDPVSGASIGGLHTDAFTLVVEVIETKIKPQKLVLQSINPACSDLRLVHDDHWKTRSLLAIGHQDTEAAGLKFPLGVTFGGATSDHIVVETRSSALRVGSEMRLQLNYNALMRVMSAPGIAKIMNNDSPLANEIVDSQCHTRLVLV